LEKEEVLSAGARVPTSIFDAYVSGGAQAFFAENFTRASDRKRAVERALRPLAARVVTALEAQNARFGASAARAEQLAALARGAAAVVTGQQVGLFLGPLYTVYKAASAIRVARALASETGSPVVPVFWLQTEDHDLPEIATCTVLDLQHQPLRLTLPAAAENRISVAHLGLPPEIDGCLAALRRELEPLPYAGVHLERLARHYRVGAAWHDAFAGLLAELFEPEGLLLIDPRDPALASEAAAVHHQALVCSAEIASALSERCAQLEQAGYAATVHVREGAPLSFFHAGGVAAPRHRLAASAGGFSEVGTGRTHTRDTLLALTQHDPRCFSTSALLRPILQDTLLPTAAYVGGPAEVAYFAQLAPLYSAFGLDMPVIVPRARLSVIEASTARLLSRLGLEAKDATAGEQALLLRLAARRSTSSPDRLERMLIDGFEQVLSGALAEVGPYDAQLAAPVAKTRDKLRLIAGKLGEKVAAALARGDQARVEDVQRLLRLLQPGGAPQERVYGLSYFAARYGERAFLEAVLAAIEPFDPAPRELRP
jgi:bacillithiol biosynthesis cysteine-adding enzyme BshC